MARKTHKPTEVHHPRPMSHEDDAVRRRWFMVSVAITSLVAVGGWMYFFSGQVRELTKHIPGITASDTLKNLADETTSFGSDAAANFNATLLPSASAVVGDVQAKLEAQAKLAGVVDELTAKLTDEPVATPEEESSEPVESNQ